MPVPLSLGGLCLPFLSERVPGTDGWTDAEVHSQARLRPGLCVEARPKGGSRGAAGLWPASPTLLDRAWPEVGAAPRPLCGPVGSSMCGVLFLGGLTSPNLNWSCVLLSLLKIVFWRSGNYGKNHITLRT